MIEWLLYYKIIAPLLSINELDKAKAIYNRYDINTKMIVCRGLCEERTGEIAKKLSLDEKILLHNRIESITALLNFLRKIEKYVNDTNAHKEEDALLIKQMEIAETAYAKEKFNRNEMVAGFSSAGQDIYSKLYARRGQRSSLRTNISFTIKSCQKPFVLKLLQCFPVQRQVVHEYLNKAGFSKDEVDRVWLLKGAVGERDATTEWLFQGLPSEAKVLQITTERFASE